jgi:hypothetical protein
MIHRNLFATLAAAAILPFMLVAPVHAEMIDPSGDHADPTFAVLGTNIQLTEFASSKAGTVTLTLHQVPWGALLSTLSTTISFSGRDDLHMTGYGQTIFDVAQNERFTTGIYAVASGLYRYGAYRFDMQFTPRVAEVPLPAAGWMLLTGMAALAARSRRRRAAAV